MFRLSGHALLWCLPTILLCVSFLSLFFTEYLNAGLPWGSILGNLCISVHLLGGLMHFGVFGHLLLHPPPTPPPTHCPALCPGKGRSDSYKWHCPTSLISCLEGGFGQWEAPARGWKKREGVGVFHSISVLLQNEFLAMVVSFCTFSETFQISQEHLYLFPRAAVNGLPQTR